MTGGTEKRSEAFFGSQREAETGLFRTVGEKKGSRSFFVKKKMDERDFSVCVCGSACMRKRGCGISHYASHVAGEFFFNRAPALL